MSADDRCDVSITYTNGYGPSAVCALPRGHKGVHSNGKDVAWTR